MSKNKKTREFPKKKVIQHCGCMATTHEFAASCIECGKILCVEEFSGVCTHCEAPVIHPISSAEAVENGFDENAIVAYKQKVMQLLFPRDHLLTVSLS